MRIEIMQLSDTIRQCCIFDGNRLAMEIVVYKDDVDIWSLIELIASSTSASLN